MYVTWSMGILNRLLPVYAYADRIMQISISASHLKFSLSQHLVLYFRSRMSAREGLYLSVEFSQKVVYKFIEISLGAE